MDDHELRAVQDARPAGLLLAINRRVHENLRRVLFSTAGVSGSVKQECAFSSILRPLHVVGKTSAVRGKNYVSGAPHPRQRAQWRMPTWAYGIGVALLMLLRPAIFGWLFGFFKREIGSLLSVSAEEKLQRDAAAAREAAQRRTEDPPPSS